MRPPRRRPSSNQMRSGTSDATSGTERKRDAHPPASGERANAEQDGHGRDRQTDLLQQHEAEEYDVPVLQQDLNGVAHGCWLAKRVFPSYGPCRSKCGIGPEEGQGGVGVGNRAHGSVTPPTMGRRLGPAIRNSSGTQSPGDRLFLCGRSRGDAEWRPTAQGEEIPCAY